jgi:hypothetical protein
MAIINGTANNDTLDYGRGPGNGCAEPQRCPLLTLA